jgi:hypothetical protein
MLPWNAYPWYINKAPTAREVAAGVSPLRRLLSLLPNLRVVMLNGGEAKLLWRKFASDYPGDAERYAVLPTYHPGRQAFIAPPAERERRRAQLRESFEAAARLIG